MEYPAKILLFGEYRNILNSMSLAIPFPRYSGQFRFPATSTGLQSKSGTESNEELKKLFDFLKTNTNRFQFIDLKLFENEVNQGLYFDSSVPVGAGLGSSGALTAAIYERYLIHSQNSKYQTIKSDLAAIETYFQGKSSGFDPLVSLLKKPLLMNGKSSMITDIDLSDFFRNYTLYLINSNPQINKDASTNLFMKKYQNQGFKQKIDNEYTSIINRTIEAVIDPDFRSFETQIARYSEFQLHHLGEMIPQHMKTHFEYGIKTSDFYLKLCGSGNNGYFIGIARERSVSESYFNLNHLDWMDV
jgi:mevalonate kinase